MFVKLFIVTIMLVTIIMLAMGVKLWFDPDAEFSSHSCGINDGKLNKDVACSMCQLKDLSDCSVEKDSRLGTKLYNALINNLL